MEVHDCSFLGLTLFNLVLICVDENPNGTWKLVINDSYSLSKNEDSQTDNEDIAEKLIDTQKEKQQKYVDQQKMQVI